MANGIKGFGLKQDNSEIEKAMDRHKKKEAENLEIQNEDDEAEEITSAAETSPVKRRPSSPKTAKKTSKKVGRPTKESQGQKKKQQVAAYLDEPCMEFVKKLAADQERSISWIIEKLIRDKYNEAQEEKK